MADVTIGISLPLTGPASGLGIPMANYIKIWPTSIAGEKLKVIVLDDATDPTKGVNNAKRFVTEDKVDIIMGSAATPVAIPMASVAAESGTVQFAFSPAVLGEAGVTEAFCQQHFEECRRQRNATEAHLLDFQALLADAQPGLDIDEAAGPHVGKEGRQRGGVADVGAALAQRERGVALDAAAGGKVEQGFEVRAAEADVTGAAGGHSARIVLAQDSLRPADGGRRQFVRGGDQGPHFEGLDAQQDQGCQRQHDAGRQPGKETEHWGLG